jgi:hypothetical protein
MTFRMHAQELLESPDAHFGARKTIHIKCVLVREEARFVLITHKG